MKPIKSRRIFHNSSTMRENNTLDLVDRISDLPDSILGLILSNLPTKNAVATTILSKRWKFVWTNVHNLDFCLKNWMKKLPEDVDIKFVRFVNRVLLLVDGELLNKFSLVWAPRFIPSQVSTWIDNVIARNVHHFFVCVWSFHTNYEAFEMPISLFSCVSLQSLELNGSINLSAAVVVCLPRLESLKLGSVYFQSEEAFEKLIYGCPMLNYLRLCVDVNKMVTYSKVPSLIFKDFTYTIASTSLRSLEFDVKFSDFWYTPSLKLKASSLEYLKLAGYIPQISVQGTLSSLVEADFTIRYSHNKLSEDTYNSVVEVVRAFDCAKALTLSMEAMWAISNATICLSTKFKRLTKLKAEAISCYCSALQDFIQSSDNLEVLTVKQDARNLEELDEDQFDSKWIAPVEVPRCLSNSLKEVSFYGYAGLNDEREMIGYMLKHGSALEVMQVTCHTWKRKELELVKEIRSFPRNSRACKLQFI